MLNQSGFPHSPGRDQGEIVSVAYFPDQGFALFLPVTEIIGRYISTGYKGVSDDSHGSLL